MARIYTGGMQSLQKLFSDNINQIESKTNEILTTNSEIIAQYQRGSALKETLIDTGSMVSNIKPTPIKTGKSKNLKGIKYVQVYSQGKDDKGVSNARKAFILEYGVKSNNGTYRIQPRRWVTKANEAAEQKMFENTKNIFYS